MLMQHSLFHCNMNSESIAWQEVCINFPSLSFTFFVSTFQKMRPKSQYLWKSALCDFTKPLRRTHHKSLEIFASSQLHRICTFNVMAMAFLIWLLYFQNSQLAFNDSQFCIQLRCCTWHATRSPVINMQLDWNWPYQEALWVLKMTDTSVRFICVSRFISHRSWELLHLGINKAMQHFLFFFYCSRLFI